MANRRFIDFPIATTVGDNDIILIWQSGMNKQTTKATLLNGLPENLEDLLDVNITGLTNGQILRYDSVTGKWENTDQGNLDLDDLNDVTIVSPTNGQVLVYNSSTSKWENSSGGFVPYTGAISTVNLGAQTIQAGSFVKAGGTSSQFLKADGSVDSTAYGTGSVTSVALTMPSAFNVANSPVTTSGTLAVTGAGTVGQYIRGDGSLADFPASTGGGSSVSYYLNGSISQGTIGGVAYKELSKTPILGAGTQFTINADGYIASFLTDAGDPNLLEIPGGNWNFETYFSASSGGGSPTFYVELYKYDGSTFTLIASNSGSPELIAFGTNVNSYFSTLAVPTTALTLTDRLAIRYYVTHSGRTITLHTENNTLCQIITTFTTGLTALNGLTAQVQYFAVGTSGTDFNIASATQTHTFNLPTASASNRGALSSADWSTFNAKQNALTLTTTGSSGASTLVGATLNVPTYTLSGLGGVPTSRQLTINGTAFDLSADRSWNVGTVTSVGLSSATSGVTIGNTPVTGSGTITLAIATATSTQQGLLSSTDWSTFNNKQNAITLTTTGTSGAATLVGSTLNIPQYQSVLTNPITGTGTTNYLAKFTGSTTVGNSQVFDNGTNVGIGTTSPYANLDLGASGANNIILRNTTNAYNLGYIGNSSGRIDIGFSNSNSSLVPLPYLSVNSNGNVGIGTTSVSGTYEKLAVAGGISIKDNTNAKLEIGRYNTTGAQNSYIKLGANSNSLRFTNNTDIADIMELTNSGNLGLGVTPSAWDAVNTRALQLDGGSVYMYGGDRVFLGQNIFFGSLGDTYVKSAPATTYRQFNGTHSWFNAPSGTAGNAISFTQAMTLTSSGNLLVGTTSDNGARLQVSGEGRFTNSDGADLIRYAATGVNTNFATKIVSGANDVLVFRRQHVSVGGLDIMALGFNGNVGIGTSSPSYPLQVRRAGGAGSLGISIDSVGTTDRVAQYFAIQDNASGAGTGHAFYYRVPSSTTDVLGLFLNESGNVGIGTSSPSVALEVSGASNLASRIRAVKTGSGTIEIGADRDTFGSPYISAITNSNLDFFTNDTHRLRITSGGNVLIGTTTDNSHKLRVNGTGYFDTGIKTGNPVGSTTNDWLLGRALVSGTSTPDRWIRVQIGNLYYDILAVYMGSV